MAFLDTPQGAGAGMAEGHRVGKQAHEAQLGQACQALGGFGLAMGDEAAHQNGAFAHGGFQLGKAVGQRLRGETAREDDRFQAWGVEQGEVTPCHPRGVVGQIGMVRGTGLHGAIPKGARTRSSTPWVSAMATP